MIRGGFSMDKAAELKLMGPLKTVLMVLVVVIHSTAVWTGGWFGQPAETSSTLAMVSEWLGTFCVPAFFMASGYIYAYLKRETSRYDNSLEVMGKKARRLLIPYCFVSTVWCAPVWAAIFGPDRLVEKFVLGGSPSQLWFLLALFWVFVIAELLDALPGHMLENDAFVLAWAVALYLAGCLLGRSLPVNFWQVATAMQYTPYFLVGYLFRRKDNAGFWALSPWVFAFLDFTLFACSLAVPDQGGLGKAVSIILAPTVKFAGIAFALSLFARFGHLAECLSGSVLERDSLTIYFFHQQFIWLALLLLNEPGIPPVLVAISSFAFAMGASLAVAWALGRFKMTRFLLGQK